MSIQSTRNSALWAAYGDALGFISELASPTEVSRRVGGGPVTATITWEKRVGGKFGLDATLPAGAYSDDTQLRLATSRALRADSQFDVDAFSKIELPVWLSYALGAGKGTREAANALSRPATTWNTNFHTAYMTGGGNGAAMRIQPHVWAASGSSMEQWLPDVLRNAITTHGHPRGIFGAVFHAALLSDTMRAGRITPIDVAKSICRNAALAVPDTLRADRELRDVWIPKWENLAKRRIGDAFEETYVEVEGLISIVDRVMGSSPQAAYAHYLDQTDAHSRAVVGSGTVTSVAAYLLALLFPDDANRALVCAANAYSTDTDSIGTMAGALLGSVSSTEPGEALQDSHYIASEAERCARIASGTGRAESFSYPDMLGWKAPESAIAVVGRDAEGFQIAGLGNAEAGGDEFVRDRPASIWRWLRTGFGQHVLVKTRMDLTPLPASQLPVTPQAIRRELSARAANVEGTVVRKSAPTAVTLPFQERESSRHPERAPVVPADRRADRRGPTQRPLSLHEMTKIAIEANFSPQLVGDMLLDLADRGENGVELAISFAAIIAKARVSRQTRQGRP